MFQYGNYLATLDTVLNSSASIKSIIYFVIFFLFNLIKEGSEEITFFNDSKNWWEDQWFQLKFVEKVNEILVCICLARYRLTNMAPNLLLPQLYLIIYIY